MYLYYGYIDIRSVNLSHNIVRNSRSGLYCGATSTNETSISCSSFVNNNASSICIYLDFFESIANKNEIKNTNIINNKGTGAIYNAGGSLIMISCTITENDTPVFYGPAKLVNCSVPNTQLSGGSLDTFSIGSISFSNELSFISSDDCLNLFDKSHYKCLSFLYRNIFFIIVNAS